MMVLFCFCWPVWRRLQDGDGIPPLPDTVSLIPEVAAGKVEEERPSGSSNIATSTNPASTAESVSLAECLDNFYKVEVLGQGNKWKCPECKQLVSATKSMAIWRLPDILVRAFQSVCLFVCFYHFKPD